MVTGPVLAGDQHGPLAEVQDLVGDTAQQQGGQVAATVGAHHDQPGALVLGQVDERAGDAPERGAAQLDPSLDARVLQLGREALGEVHRLLVELLVVEPVVTLERGRQELGHVGDHDLVVAPGGQLPGQLDGLLRVARPVHGEQDGPEHRLPPSGVHRKHPAPAGGRPVPCGPLPTGHLDRVADRHVPETAPMRPGRWRRTAVAATAVVGAVAAAQWLGRTSGSTRVERKRRLPGDELVDHPTVVTNHAITIAAPPDQVWPWLAQMGWHRGGWYTAGWVDRLLFPANWPSATGLVSELQRPLRAGDHIPDGPPGTAWFLVERAEAPCLLVLHSTTHLPTSWRERLGASIDWAWTFTLDPTSDGGTRLLLRVRGRTAPWWLTAAYVATIVPADHLMAGSMLNGIRRRSAQRRTAIRPCPSSGPGERVERWGRRRTAPQMRSLVWTGESAGTS
jgi:hypothetical protein